MNEQNNQITKQPWITPQIETLPMKATEQILDPPNPGNQEFS